MTKVVKKVFSVTLFFALFSSPLYSQTFGIKAGPNLTTINFSAAAEPKNEEVGYRLGYHLGIIGILKMTQTWSLQPEIIYSDQGYRTRVGPDIRYSCKYINFPILFKYKKKDFFFYAGPQYGMLIDAQRNNKTKGSKENITSTIDSQEVAFTTGLGTMVSEKIGIEGRGLLGFTTLSDSYNFLNFGFQFSIFYLFGQQQHSDTSSK